MLPVNEIDSSSDFILTLLFINLIKSLPSPEPAKLSSFPINFPLELIFWDAVTDPDKKTVL